MLKRVVGAQDHHVVDGQEKTDRQPIQVVQFVFTSNFFPIGETLYKAHSVVGNSGPSSASESEEALGRVASEKCGGKVRPKESVAAGRRRHSCPHVV